MNPKKSLILEEIISKYSKRPQKKIPINSSSIKKNYKFSEEEKKHLKALFENSSYYPDKDVIKKLAEELNIEIMKIENWFKYERRKMLSTGKSHLLEKRKKFTKKELSFLKNQLKEEFEPSQEKIDAWAKTLNCSSNIISSWVRNLKKKQKKINSVKKTDENKECFKNSIMPTATSLQNTFNFTNPMPSFFINPLMMHFQNPLQRTFFFPMNDWNYYDFHY